MTADDGDQSDDRPLRPKLRRGIQPWLEEHELRAMADRVSLEYVPPSERTPEWVLSEVRESLRQANWEELSAGEALGRIAAVVGYQWEDIEQRDYGD